jgi:hypothetical protein
MGACRCPMYRRRTTRGTRFNVICHLSEALSCHNCVTVVQTLAPNHPIAPGQAGQISRHISSSPNSTITNRCIAKPRFTPRWD